MNNLSNDRLKQHIDNPLESGLSRSEVVDAIRELLALREAGKEPVAYMYRDRLHKDARFSYESKLGNWSPEDISEYEITETKLYAAPQRPAVPSAKEMNREEICNIVHAKCSRIPGATFYNAAEFALDEVESSRTSALIVLGEIPEHGISPLSGAEYEAGFRDGWNSYRAAIAAAPKPEMK